MSRDSLLSRRFGIMERTYLALVVTLLGCVANGVGSSAPSEENEIPGGHMLPSWSLDALATGAVALQDLGNHQRVVTTNSTEAQAFFNQGLALTYGFNHDEAARSYAKAGSLDPSCAMCWWGAALTMGPNYNMPMLADRAAAAWDALQRAQEAAAGASPVEQALVAALAKRYAGPEYVDPVAMQAFNQAYADAMRDVAKQFPEDMDVQALFAEALMNINPWKLWTPAGQPGPETLEIVATLEYVLAQMPEHPGANHYYIHAIEASPQPEKGEEAADRLGSLVPGAGHLVHMPAHIYQRVGRYADASEANRRALEADLRYLDTVEPPGYYGMYVAHNYGFWAYSASMEGRSTISIAAARKSAAQMPRNVVCGMPGMDFFLAEPFLAMVRFGEWEQLLAEPKPEAEYPVLTALWHHAHGMALAATGALDQAKSDLAAIQALCESIPEDMLAGLNSGRTVLELAAKVLEARIAEAEKSADTIALWQAAVSLEDQLEYNEPADWFYPTRHYLGAALLDAGQPKEAIAVYYADLDRNPRNGWALFGLWQAQLAAGQKAKAMQTRTKFEEAWSRADVELTRSAF
jgi:tetratricopeptide (TPR) repeat protein